MTAARTALVTGSARGIGRAIARALHASGHAVTGLDILEQDPDDLAAAITADVADPAVPARIVTAHGPIDILVDNAALFIHKPLAEFTLDDFDRTIAVNLRATFLLAQAAAPAMAERGWGRIVNISSVGARTGGHLPVGRVQRDQGGHHLAHQGFRPQLPVVPA